MGFRHLPFDSYHTWSVGALEFFRRNGVIRILGCLVFASGKAGGVRSIFISLSSFARFIVFPLLVSPIHSQIAHALQIVFPSRKISEKPFVSGIVKEVLSKASIGFLPLPCSSRPGSLLGVDLPLSSSRESTSPRLVSLGPSILTTLRYLLAASADCREMD
jgi:hypothetical protein